MHPILPPKPKGHQLSTVVCSSLSAARRENHCCQPPRLGWESQASCEDPKHLESCSLFEQSATLGAPLCDAGCQYEGWYGHRAPTTRAQAGSGTVHVGCYLNTTHNV